MANTFSVNVRERVSFDARVPSQTHGANASVINPPLSSGWLVALHWTLELLHCSFGVFYVSRHRYWNDSML